MKKTLLFFIALFYGAFLAGQSGGDGLTPGTAYYGTITTPTTWTYAYNSGTIYVGQTGVNEDLTIGTGGSLTIEAGVTIKFCTTAADLRITGTGILTAVGTSASFITFTKNIQATWGHISFEASTGNSIINYCIIEFGYKNGSSIEGYGGGIHANTNNLLVTNSIIRNNYALWGGGVFVNQSRSPSFSNCYVYNNQSGDAGGGFYFWNGAKSVITNCIFDSNHCLEPRVSFYTGGGLAAQSGTSLKILNCTFVNNTSTQPTGKSIMLYSSSGDLVLNCIVWSNTNTGNQFYLTGINTIQYTAVVGSAPTGVGNFVLSTNNSDPAGPNFNNPASADWSIKYISPFRDAGVDSYGSPNIVPATDILGNSRTLTTDIGAYELVYSRWKTAATSIDWNLAANWDGGAPASDRVVIIPTGAGNYPTAYPGPDFTIGAGKLILEPGARATLNSLTNNGGILSMEANATELSSLIMGSYTRGTSAGEDIQIYLTGGYTNPPNNSEGRWHYISSPVDGMPITVFTSNTLDLARWVDGIQGPGTPREGWVAYDGFAYLIDDPAAEDPSTWFGYPNRFDNLELGKGYNFWDDLASNTYSISGQLNTQDRIVSLSFAGAAYENGFNLLGNPFTSGLDWDYILTNTTYPENTSHGIIFTKNNIQYYYNGGVQVPNDGSPAGVIPPMQGFFVKTLNSAASINLTAAARTHNEIHPRYKGFAPVPLIRLELTENGLSDETVVRFAETAKSDFDYEFDALKMFLPSTAIYTTSPGMKYAINGQPYPDTFVEIPVSVIIPTDGTHSITVKQLEGLENYSVAFIDKTTGFSADLKTISEVTFSASKGTIDDRFILKISNGATAIVNPKTSDKSFNIYNGFGKVNIQTVSDSWDGKQGSVSIRDLTGRIIEESANVEFSRSSVIQLDAPVVRGMYIVEVKSGMKKYAGKVIIQ